MFRGEVIGIEEEEEFTVTCTCKLRSEKLIELYSKYYEGYIKRANTLGQINEGSIPVLSFNAYWYVDSLSVKFDGFKLKAICRADVNKIIQLLKKFEEKRIDVEIDLSSSRV